MLYSVIFGSEKFEYYIGELDFIHSTLFDKDQGRGDGDGNANVKKQLYKHPKIKKFMKNQREIQVASNINELLNKYIDYMHYVHNTEIIEKKNREVNKSNNTSKINMDADAVFTQKNVTVLNDMFVELVTKDVKDMCRTKLGASLVRCIGEGILESLYQYNSVLSVGGSDTNTTTNTNTSTSTNSNTNSTSNTNTVVNTVKSRNIINSANLLNKLRINSYQLKREVGNKVSTLQAGVQSLSAIVKSNRINSRARGRLEQHKQKIELERLNSSGSSSSSGSSLMVQEDSQSHSQQIINDNDNDDDDDESESELELELTSDEKKQIANCFKSIRDNM